MAMIDHNLNFPTIFFFDGSVNGLGLFRSTVDPKVIRRFLIEDNFLYLIQMNNFSSLLLDLYSHCPPHPGGSKEDLGEVEITLGKVQSS